MIVDPETALYTELWRACAGPLVTVPLEGERVFYFPQGHIEQLGVDTVPVLVGPVSYLLLSKPAKGVEKSFSLLSLLDKILPIYKEVVAELKAAGASWIQFDEPTLVKDLESHQLQAFTAAYSGLESALSGLNVIVETYFADVPAEAFKILTSLKCVTGFGFDLVRGAQTLDLITSGFPSGKYLFAGVVDGRNIWANDLAASLSLLQTLEGIVGKDKLVVSTSCSLLHTAVDLVNETKFDKELKSWLAFAAQKVVEVNSLAKALAGHKDEAFFSENAAAQASRKSSPRVTNEAVQKAAAAAKSGKSSAMSAAAAASALAGEGTAHMPRLFSFLSADNQGMEAYFHAQFLVVEVGSGRGKKASLHFTHAFKPQCWYFVGLEHTCKQGLIGKAESELKLYIDGSLYESRPFDFPRISKPLVFCCIGTNPPPTIAGLQRRRRQCPLFDEMGPIYIFKEPIGPERMSSLASRGGDVLPSFGYGAGLPWLATNERVQSMAEESALLDAEIGGCIHLLYHPNLLSGRFCPDASPSGAAGMLRRPAEVLGQVHVATRMRPVEALWALAYGGPMSLLPLTVSNVHENSLEPQQGNLSLSLATTTLAAPIFRIIAMAIQHPRNNEELCHTRGPEVLSRILNYLLQTLSSLDVGKHDGVGDEGLLVAVVALCQSQKYNHALRVQLFSTLLLDLKIWSLCNYGLQKKLLSPLADMVITESSVMRDANAIQMLLDGCRRCYWTIHENDSVNTFSLNEVPRPVGEVNALVDELLVVIELLLVAAPPSLAMDDVRCLLGFMVDCPQPNQVARVLHLIYRLVVQPNTSRAQTFAEAFISCGGIETLLVLLQREAKAGDTDHPDTSIV